MTAVNGGTPPRHRMVALTVLPTPVWAKARRSVRLPAFWLLIVLLVLGTGRLFGILWPLAHRYPAAATVAVLLFGLYAVPFLLVVRSLDFMEREPPALVVTAFAWGGLVAVSTAAAGGGAGHDLLAKETSVEFASSWGSAIVAPLVEEPVKLLGVVIIVLIARHHVNSVVDGLVYGALVGLGFQVVEDVAFALGQVNNTGQGDRLAPVIAVFLLRGFIGGLWSHTVFSAIAGGGVAYALIRREQPVAVRLGMAGLALLSACAFHFVWNSPWLSDGFGAGGLGVLAALVLKGMPALILVAVLIRITGRREADYYISELAGYGDEELATEREREALRTGRGRLAARRLAKDRRGRGAAVAVRRLQHAQARVAVELSRGGDELDRYRRRALEQRDLLRRLGHPEAFAPSGAQAPWWLGVVVVLAAGLFVLLFLAALRSLGGG